jgi:twinkle protein
MDAGSKEEKVLAGPHKDWLAKRGFTDETVAKFGLHSQTDRQGKTWLRLPFVESGVVVNHKWRKTMAKDHRMDAGAPLLLFNHDALAKAVVGSDKKITITEGEWDCLAAVQSGWTATVSVPNGAPQEATEDVFEATRYEWVHRHAKELSQIKQFVLATDNDEAGRILAADLARLLGPERCMFVEYPTGCKDLNDVLLAHGGLYALDDFPDPPDFRPITNGIEGLEDLWPLVPGTLSVITGWPGHGKSSLVLSAVAAMVKNGVPIAMGSFETMVKPVLQRRLRACFYGCDEQDPKCKARGPADDAFALRFRVISNLHVDDNTELTIERIIENAIVSVLRDGIRLLIIDPWNEVEHQRGRDETESEYVGRAIRLLKRFGRDYGCAVWVVAHPRKPASDGAPRRPSLLDLAGSANFANKADYGIIFHRPDLENDLVDVVVTKKRMGLPGAMGMVTLRWHPSTSSYSKPVYL